MWQIHGPSNARQVASYSANGKVPHGPVMGCHVAPFSWLVGLCKILWTLSELNPKPPPRYGLVGPGLPLGLLVLLNMYTENMVFKFG
jgi:hypothetical protein